MSDYQSKYTGEQIDALLDLVNQRESSPRAGSDKPITAGGVKTALDGKADSSSLAAVATSGDYNALNNKPTIPTRLSQLSSDTAHQTVTDAEKATWNGKQNAIGDLATIRSGASKGATAYQKPSTGIPKSDLSSAVQASLDKADAAASAENTYTKTQTDNLLSGKVNKVEGKGLSTNDYTNAEKTKLTDLPTNANLTSALNGKVDKVEGKGLSECDYTSAEKSKLTNLPTNADLTSALSGKVDKIEGKGLSSNDYTTAEKEKLASLQTGAQISAALDGKVDKVAGKGLSESDYTSAEKSKLAALPTNADLTTSLNGKVDKETGKGLSTNDYTDLEKKKVGLLSDASNIHSAAIEVKQGVGAEGINLQGERYNGSQIVDTTIRTHDYHPSKEDLVDDLNATQPARYKLYPSVAAVKGGLSGKVDKEDGKDLSTNDYTDSEKTKLAALPTNAELNTALDGKADKVAAATEGNLAALDENGNIVDSGLPSSDVAKEDGYYSTLVAGAAENLVGRGSVGAGYIRRKTGGGTDVGDGTALIKVLKGRSVVWNQIVNGAFESLSGWQNQGITSRVNDGVVTITKNGTSASYLQATYSVISDHKYYYAGTLAYTGSSGNARISIGFRKQDSAGVGMLYVYSSDKQRVSGVIVPEDAVRFTIRITPNSADIGETGTAESVMLVDLTMMFGAGNEPATAEEFEALFPLAYYEQNAGAIINNKATGIETIGFNQWDEQWELGTYNQTTGRKTTSEKAIRSKNRQRCLPDTQYYVKTPTRLIVCFYDAEQKYLSSVDNVTAGFTSPMGACYFAFCTYNNDNVTTYNNDICINFSDSARNGEYQPYWKNVLNLLIPTLTGKKDGTGESVIVCPDGMRQAGSTRDEGVVENSYLTKIVRKIGVREYQSYDDSDSTVLTDGTDTNYPLETPETFILDTPVYVGYRVDGLGMESVLPENGSTPTTAPIAYDVAYPFNAVDRLRNLGKNFIGVDSMEHILSAFQGAGIIGGYTLTYNAETDNYACTITPPNNE